VQHLGGLLTPFDLVDVGIGPIGDDHVDRVDHEIGHIAVRIEGGNDRDVGADGIADRIEEDAIGVLLLGGDHRPVIAQVDAIQAPGVGERATDLVDRGEEEVVLAGAAGTGDGVQDRHRLPAAELIHGPVEADDLEGLSRVLGSSISADVVLLEIEVPPLPLDDSTGEGVALDEHADNGDPAIRHPTSSIDAVVAAWHRRRRSANGHADRLWSTCWASRAGSGLTCWLGCGNLPTNEYSRNPEGL